MANPLRLKAWSPYVVGAGIGILSWLTFLTANQPLGITTAFESCAAMVEANLMPQAIEGNTFFEKTLKIDWGWMLVLGVFMGAWMSSWMSGDRKSPSVPPLWASRFGNAKSIRFLGAFLGGMIMMIGARLAGGCTSGHGISGSLQLAASGWMFVLVAFSSGIITAWLLYARKGSSDA